LQKIWAKMDRNWPKKTGNDRNQAEIRPSTQKSGEINRKRTKSEQIWPKLAENKAKCNRTKQNKTNPGEMNRHWAKFEQILGEIYQKTTKKCKNRAKSIENRRNWPKIPPNHIEIRQNLAYQGEIDFEQGEIKLIKHNTMQKKAIYQLTRRNSAEKHTFWRKFGASKAKTAQNKAKSTKKQPKRPFLPRPRAPKPKKQERSWFLLMIYVYVFMVYATFYVQKWCIWPRMAIWW